MESKIEQRLGQWHGGKGVITDIEINVGNCDFVPFSLLVKKQSRKRLDRSVFIFHEFNSKVLCYRRLGAIHPH